MNATQLQPSKTRPTYRSHGRIWQLWTDGRGERSIHYWDRDGNHRVVAYMKTKRRTERSGYGYKTLVSWVVYQERWMTKYSGEHKSDIEAFRSFTKCL